jgi:phosphohistidine phosphatase
MKTIYFIRHAKSSWSDLEVVDFDRKLNKRGKRDAPFMGKKLAERGVMPHAIYSSPAYRARKTAETIAKEIGFPEKNIVYQEELYTFSTRQLLGAIQELPNSEEELFVVGHNHAITDLVNILTGVYIDNVPTAGIAAIGFKAKSWEKVKVGKGKLLFFDYPKKYGNRG